MEPFVLLLLLIPVGFLWLVVTVVRSALAVRELREHVSELRGEILSLRREREQKQQAAPLETKPFAVRPLRMPTYAAPESAPAVAGEAVAEPPVPSPEPAQPPTLIPPILPRPEPWRANPPLAAEESVPAPEPSSPFTPKPPINWEQFLGAKMFAWIGGLAFFLGVAFFIRYSFEHNLIPPELRVALGFLAGLGLVTGGVFIKRKEYTVLSQSLCATGVVVLYASAFGANALYHLIGSGATFLLMSLITAAAFLLAVRMNAQVVAVLGLVGGFLTPPLLSTGVDNPLGLFGYVALLNLGLMAVVFRRGWNYLVALALTGTILMEFGWVGKFFTAEKVFVAQGVFLGFSLFYGAALLLGEKLRKGSQYLIGAAVAQPLATMGFAFYLMDFSGLVARPGVLFTFLFGADLILLGVILLRAELGQLQAVAGIVAFLFLALWTKLGLSDGLLFWAMGAYLLFAALHTVFPLLMQRLRPEASKPGLAHLFPPLALILFILPMLLQETVSLVLWPCILMVDMLAFGLAILTASVASLLSVLLVTAALTLVWIFRVPVAPVELTSLLLIIGFFAIFFFAGSLLLFKKLGKAANASLAWAQGDPTRFIPALSAVLPFLLLIMATTRLPMDSPSSLFGLALLLVALLLGLVKTARLDILVFIGLGCLLGVEYTWFTQHFTPDVWGASTVWFLLFHAVFALFPFVFRRDFAERISPWAASALSGPLHFYLVHKAFTAAWPGFGFNGLLPILFVAPPLLSLVFFLKALPPENPTRLRLLAWYGGAALFFITLIFPIQFDRQWITIGWALEGAALVWLFRRVPHPGLRATGVALLLVAFARLGMNPAVFSYSPRSETPIFNWFLYAYGIVTVCLMAGGKLLAPPRHLVLGRNVPPVLYTLGTVLGFFLLNIEIADYFAQGPRLSFHFSGSLAQDMTYSIAWALFAVGLLLVGIQKRLRPVRYSSMALLGVTLLKLFLHDLRELGQLYRIGAFIGVAVILMVASWLYQRFLAIPTPEEQPK